MSFRDNTRKLCGNTYWIMTGCGKLYITINKDSNKNIIEVFSNMGKAGGCNQCFSEAKAKLISILLQSDVDVKHIIKQLVGIQCSRISEDPVYGKVLSCSDAVAKVLKGELDNGNKYK